MKNYVIKMWGMVLKWLGTTALEAYKPRIIAMENIFFLHGGRMRIEIFCKFHTSFKFHAIFKFHALFKLHASFKFHASLKFHASFKFHVSAAPYGREKKNEIKIVGIEC